MPLPLLRALCRTAPARLRAAGGALLSALLLVALLAAPAAAAPPALQLDPARPLVDAWPATTMLADPGHRLDVAGALAAREAFTAPAAPAGNLGRRDDTVWLRWVVEPAAGTPAGDWWLAIDYPSLDEVELFVVRDGQVVQRAAMGDHVPPGERATALRLPAVRLALAAGQRHELLLRVRTTSTMIVPLQVVQAPALLAAEGRLAGVQGLLAGLGVALLAYTLLSLVVYRDALYLWFGAATVATTLFFAAYHGLAAQTLWPGVPWLVRNAAPLAMLAILAAGTMFVDSSLQMPRHAPRASLAMRAVAALALVGGLLFVAGAIGYRGASALASAIGLLPMLIAVPVAWRRARAGDPIARWTFAGWLVYAAGVGVFALLQAGRLPFAPLVHHAFQAGSVAEMGVWVVIVALRSEALRRQAAQARREHAQLANIARSDPLTGLLNRRGLDQALPALLPAAEDVRVAAVYVIDLDGFKLVNDEHGHAAGDELLQQVAARLKRAVRAGDLVARTGGDEFVVVVGGLEGAREAEQIGHKLLACGEAAFDLAQARCSVGMTVGYALAPADGSDAAALIRRADSAMYAGKNAGKRRLARAGGAAAAAPV